MQFALALPWYVLVLIAAGVAAVAWAAYAGVLVPLTPRRRAVLSTLRGVTLALLIVCLLRPVRVMPPNEASDAIVPVLVDVSRSMRLSDADGRPRIEAAADLVQSRVMPALRDRFRTEVWTFGETLAQQPEGAPFRADGNRSDLPAALRAVRERYRERRVAGILVISDGGDTSPDEAASAIDDRGVPVYAVGVGERTLGHDLELLDVSAGEAALADSSVDLTITAVSRGSAEPFDVRILENGRPVDVRRVVPSASGSPVREVVTVAPSRDVATLYTAEIASVPGEAVRENNSRSLVVAPPGRKRRVLVVEGAPGFEHTFMKRALALDPGIEVDSVVRKGRNDQGDATYFVQAAASRAPGLTNGFPTDRELLFSYDALILANIQPDLLARTQLEAAAAFVSERGGGLLVLGAKSFAQQGLVGTALEDVLPVDLNDRSSGVVRASAGSGGEAFRVAVTDDGAAHPVMRVGATPQDSAKKWAVVPALAGASSLGAPRPGAQVLATVQAADGARPLLAVQRFGQGRSMVFTGEASWQWRMKLPSEDRTHELFWRQAARWLASGSPDPVSLAPVRNVVPGGTVPISVDVRDRAHEPVRDAQVSMRVTLPGGDVRDVRAVLTDPRTGRYSGDVRFERPGAYRVAVDARRGETPLGSAERWVLAGAADTEMADPRLNEDVLRRLARASGGQYLSASDLARLPALLATAQSEPPPPRLVELWHNPWIFGAVILLLGTEWFLRRRWGLR